MGLEIGVEEEREEGERAGPPQSWLVHITLKSGHGLAIRDRTGRSVPCKGRSVPCTGPCIYRGISALYTQVDQCPVYTGRSVPCRSVPCIYR